MKDWIDDLAAAGEQRGQDALNKAAVVAAAPGATPKPVDWIDELASQHRETPSAFQSGLMGRTGVGPQGSPVEPTGMDAGAYWAGRAVRAPRVGLQALGGAAKGAVYNIGTGTPGNVEAGFARIQMPGEEKAGPITKGVGGFVGMLPDVAMADLLALVGVPPTATFAAYGAIDALEQGGGAWDAGKAAAFNSAMPAVFKAGTQSVATGLADLAKRGLVNPYHPTFQKLLEISGGAGAATAFQAAAEGGTNATDTAANLITNLGFSLLHPSQFLRSTPSNTQARLMSEPAGEPAPMGRPMTQLDAAALAGVQRGNVELLPVIDRAGNTIAFTPAQAPNLPPVAPPAAPSGKDKEEKPAEPTEAAGAPPKTGAPSAPPKDVFGAEDYLGDLFGKPAAGDVAGAGPTQPLAAKPTESDTATSAGSVEVPAPKPGVAPATSPAEDIKTASETTEALVSRTKVGPDRDSAFTARAQAAKRVSATLKAGDEIHEPDGTKVTVVNVFRNGDLWVRGESGEEGQYYLAPVLIDGGKIVRRGSAEAPATSPAAAADTTNPQGVPLKKHQALALRSTEQEYLNARTEEALNEAEKAKGQPLDPVDFRQVHEQLKEEYSQLLVDARIRGITSRAPSAEPVTPAAPTPASENETRIKASAAERTPNISDRVQARTWLVQNHGDQAAKDAWSQTGDWETVRDMLPPAVRAELGKARAIAEGTAAEQPQPRPENSKPAPADPAVKPLGGGIDLGAALKTGSGKPLSPEQRTALSPTKGGDANGAPARPVDPIKGPENPTSNASTSGAADSRTAAPTPNFKRERAAARINELATELENEMAGRKSTSDSRLEKWRSKYTAIRGHVLGLGGDKSLMPAWNDTNNPIRTASDIRAALQRARALAASKPAEPPAAAEPPPPPPTAPAAPRETYGLHVPEHLRHIIDIVPNAASFPQWAKDWRDGENKRLAAAGERPVPIEDVGAIYDPDTGRTVFNAEKFAGKPLLWRSKLLHETIIHHGLRVAMGADGYQDFCRRVWSQLDQETRDRVRDRNGIKLPDKLSTAEDIASFEATVGDEWLAYEAERVMRQGTVDSTWSRIADAVRGFLRMLGMKEKLSDTEIARLIALGEKAVDPAADRGKLKPSETPGSLGMREPQGEHSPRTPGASVSREGSVGAETSPQTGATVITPKRMSVADYNEVWRPDALEYLKRNGVPEEEAKRWLEDMDRLVAMARARIGGVGMMDRFPIVKKLAESLGISAGGTVQRNQPYIFSWDASGICTLRIPATSYLNSVVAELGRRGVDQGMDPLEREIVMTTLARKGMQRPCVICYVETRRAIRQGMADKYTRWLTGEGEPLKPEDISNASLVFGMRSYAGEYRNLTEQDLGFQHFGGGLRGYSISDFLFEHAVDMMQMISDAAARGARMHFYTKQPGTIDMLRDTNAKINLSLVPIQDEAGNFIERKGESFPWELAKQLAASHPDIGITMFVANDAQLAWALKQPWVHYVLPWHKSGMVSGQANSMEKLQGWHNYEKANGRNRDAEQYLYVEDPVKWAQFEKEFRQRFGDVDHVPTYKIGWFLDGQAMSDLEIVTRALADSEKYGFALQFDRWMRNPDGTPNPNAAKLLKDYGRTDTPQYSLQPKFSRERFTNLMEAWIKEGGSFKPASPELTKEIADAVMRSREWRAKNPNSDQDAWDHLAKVGLDIAMDPESAYMDHGTKPTQMPAPTAQPLNFGTPPRREAPRQTVEDPEGNDSRTKREQIMATPPVVLSGKEIADFSGVTKAESLKAFRRKAVEWVRSKLVDPIKNASTRWDIIVTPKGVEDALWHGSGPEKIQAVAAVPDLLKTAVLLGSSPDVRGRPLTYHVFGAPLEIGQRKFIAGLVVREDHTGRRFYDHELSTIESLGAVSSESGDASQSEVGQSRPHQGFVQKILRDAWSGKLDLPVPGRPALQNAESDGGASHAATGVGGAVAAADGAAERAAVDSMRMTTSGERLRSEADAAGKIGVTWRDTFTFFRRSLTDKLKLAGGKLASELEPAVQKFFDTREDRAGYYGKRAEDLVRDLPRAEATRALKEAEDYRILARIKPEDRTPPVVSFLESRGLTGVTAEQVRARASAAGRRIIDGASELLDKMGDETAATGVLMMDPRTGEWVKFRKQANYWMSRPTAEIDETLRDPNADPAKYDALVADLEQHIAHRWVTRANEHVNALLRIPGMEAILNGPKSPERDRAVRQLMARFNDRGLMGSERLADTWLSSIEGRKLLKRLADISAETPGPDRTAEDIALSRRVVLDEIATGLAKRISGSHRADIREELSDKLGVDAVRARLAGATAADQATAIAEVARGLGYKIGTKSKEKIATLLSDAAVSNAVSSPKDAPEKYREALNALADILAASGGEGTLGARLRLAMDKPAIQTALMLDLAKATKLIAGEAQLMRLQSSEKMINQALDGLNPDGSPRVLPGGASAPTGVEGLRQSLRPMDPAKAQRLAEDWVRDYTTSRLQMMRGEDRMGNIEHGAVGGIPPHWIEYRFQEAMPRYIQSWAKRIAEIQSFGQGATPDVPDMFDRIAQQTPDVETRDYLAALKRDLMGLRPVTPAEKMTRWAQAYTAVAKLGTGNLMGTLKNFSQVFVMTPGQFGVGSLGRELMQLHKLGQRISTARDIGSLRADLIGGYIEARTFEDNAQKVVRAGMATSGWSVAEETSRAIALGMADNFQRVMLPHIAARPNALDSIRAKRMFDRLGVDWRKLSAEGIAGAEGRKYLRAAVRDTMFSYDLRQVGLWANAPTARFLFQFQKFSLQMSRFIDKNVLEPAWKGYKLEPGERPERRLGVRPGELGLVMIRGRLHDFRPMLMFAAAVGGAELLLGLRSALFGKDRPDPDWSEIANTWDEKKARGAWLASVRLWRDGIYLGAFGSLGDWGDNVNSFFTRLRGKSPLNPPAFGTIQNVFQNIFARWIQQGRPTLDMFTDFLKTELPGANYGAALVTTQGAAIADAIGAQWDVAALARAERQRKLIQGAMRRFADEAQFDERAPSMNTRGFNERSPDYQAIYERLMVGDVKGAIAKRDEMLASAESFDERKRLVQGIRSMVQTRQPARIGGLAPDDNKTIKADFESWLAGRDPELVPVMKEVQNRYMETAHAAGLAGDPRDLALRDRVSSILEGRKFADLKDKAQLAVAAKTGGISQEQAQAGEEKIKMDRLLGVNARPAPVEKVLEQARSGMYDSLGYRLWKSNNKKDAAAFEASLTRDKELTPAQKDDQRKAIGREKIIGWIESHTEKRVTVGDIVEAAKSKQK